MTALQTVGSSTTLEWPIPPDISDATALENRDLMAERLHVRDPDAVLRTEIKIERLESIDEFFDLFRILRPDRLDDRGIEVGSGTVIVCQD